MDFSVPSGVITSFVNIVSRVVSNKSNLPILNNLLISVKDGFFKLVGTDLEVQITASYSLTPKADGTTTVNSKAFSQYINSLTKEETVAISQEKNKLTVSTNNSRADFTTKSAQDFHLFEESEKSLLLEIDSDSLSLMIDKTLFSCSKDEVRPILTGVLFEVEAKSLVMVSLDTYRLSKISAVINNQVLEREEFVVSSLALEAIQRVIKDQFMGELIDTKKVSFYMSKSKNFIVIEYGPISICTRLLEGEYPNYKDIIPSAYETEITAEKTAILNALKRVAVFAQSAINQKLYITTNGSTASLEAFVPEIGNVKDELPVEVKGNNIKIAFQLRFLSDIINNINDENVVMRVLNNESPCIFIDNTVQSYIHLLMPLNIE